MGEFGRQNRGGKGVKCYKITEKTGNVVGIKAVDNDNEIMIINTEGIVIRMKCADISTLGRVTSGVKLINLTNEVTVASIAKVRKGDEDESNEKVSKEIRKINKKSKMQDIIQKKNNYELYPAFFYFITPQPIFVPESPEGWLLKSSGIS